MKKYLYFLMLLSMGLYAEDLSLESAVKITFENNNEIKKIEKDMSIKELDYNKSRKMVLPKLKYSGNIMKYSEETTVFDGLPVLLAGGYEVPYYDVSYSNRLTLEQPIYAGGAISSGIKLLNISKDAEKLKYVQKKREIRQSVIENYLTVLKLEKNKSILINSLNELIELSKITKDSVDLQLIQKKPLLDLNYRIADLKTSIIGIDNQIEIAKMKLKSYMGLSLDEEINLTDNEIPTIKLENIDLKDDLNFALENKSIIKTLEMSKEVSKANQKIEKADLLPKVNFKMSYELFDKTHGYDIDASDKFWTAEISVSMNIFDFGMSYDDVKKAGKEFESKEIDEKNSKDNIKIGIRASYLELQRIEQVILVKEESLSSAKENYRIEKDKYDVNLETSTDLLNAENNLSKVEVELSNAKIDMYLAYIKYVDLIERDEI